MSPKMKNFKRLFRSFVLLAGLFCLQSLPVNSQVTNKGMTYALPSLTIYPSPYNLVKSNLAAFVTALVNTNGVTNVYVLTYDPANKTINPVNSATFAELILTGDLVVQGQLVLNSPIGLGSLTNAVLSEAEAASLYQALNSNLTRISAATFAQGSLIYRDANGLTNLPPGSVGQHLAVQNGPLLGWVDVASSGLSWDIDATYVVTNTDSTVYTVFTNTVPDGVSRLYELVVSQKGSTNGGGSWKLYADISNLSGVVTATNWIAGGGATDTNAFAILTNNGANLLVKVRGPLYQPQNGRIRGTYLQVTNAGAYASDGGGGGGSSLTNNMVAFWAMTNTGSASEPDLITGANSLTVSSGDTIANVPIVQGMGRDFETGDDDYMYGVSNSIVDLGSNSSFTLLCWATMESGSVFKQLMRKPGSFSLSVSSGNLLQLTVNSVLTNRTLVGPNIGTGTNYLIACTHDATNDAISIRVFEPAGSRLVSQAYTEGTTNTGSALWVSAIDTDTTVNWDGLIGSIAILHRAMSSNEVSQVYNSGTGLAFPWNP